MWPQQVVLSFYVSVRRWQSATVMANQEKKVPFDPKLYPDILVVQPAQDRQRQNVADGLDGTRYRRILVQ